MAVRTTPVGTAVGGAQAAAATMNGAAGGWIGYAEVTADQAGITVEVDLTGLTVTVTVGTSRRIKITAAVYPVSTVANDIVTVKIAESATILQTRSVSLPVSGANGELTAICVLTPSVGAHTYKLRMVRVTGSVTSSAGATFPAFLLVEDLGPA